MPIIFYCTKLFTGPVSEDTFHLVIHVWSTKIFAQKTTQTSNFPLSVKKSPKYFQGIFTSRPTALRISPAFLSVLDYFCDKIHYSCQAPALASQRSPKGMRQPRIPKRTKQPSNQCFRGTTRSIIPPKYYTNNEFRKNQSNTKKGNPLIQQRRQRRTHAQM